MVVEVEGDVVAVDAEEEAGGETVPEPVMPTEPLKGGRVDTVELGMVTLVVVEGGSTNIPV